MPANFLNDGLYSVNVLVLNRVRVQEVFAREVIRFSVHDTGAMRAEFGGRWIGVVRPRLGWRTDQISDAVAPPCKPVRADLAVV